MRVYNNGAQTEWVFGQRAQNDHDFTVTSLVSGNYFEKMRLNMAGQLKIGNGNFFNYEEGTWTPTAESTAFPVAFTYTIQSGSYVRIGKQVTIQFKLLFDYGGSLGGFLLIKGIPAHIAMPGGSNPSPRNNEVTCEVFDGEWGGLARPWNATLWRDGYMPAAPALTMDGRTITIGAYRPNYTPAAFLITGAQNQNMWGTLTYFL
jgi:hypothetical protein